MAMSKVRLVGGLSWSRLVLDLKAAMDDPDVRAVIVHKPGDVFRTDDGVEVLVTADGQFCRVDRLPAVAVGGC
jgi:hypothetical protein